MMKEKIDEIIIKHFNETVKILSMELYSENDSDEEINEKLKTAYKIFKAGFLIGNKYSV